MNIQKLSTRVRTAVGMASIATLLIGGATAALAAGNVNVSGSNGTTGFNSLNTNKTHINNDTSVWVSQHGTANTDADVTVSSGGNKVKDNTTVAGFSTGDVMVMGSVDNSVNSSDPIVMSDPSSSDVTATFGNNITGSSSTNKNSLNVDNDSSVHVSRSATINNNVDASLSNGNNTISHNTTVGDVSTGDVSFDVTSTNMANSTPLDLSSVLGGSSDVTVSGSNGTTGANSENTNTVNVNNNSHTSVNDSSTINNSFGVSASTGNNKIDNNTTVGDVSLGGSSVSLNISNTAN